MSEETPTRNYVLGLDLGSASVGWALVELDSVAQPVGLIRAGVRIFQPGVEGSIATIQQGKDKSRAVARREARLHRRQLRRRAARQRDLFILLQQHGLLPLNSDESIAASPDERHNTLNVLDQALAKSLRVHLDAATVDQLLPYVLRRAALDRKLQPFELGRVFYHLIQRRGFKSNRRESGKKDKKEELGLVKTSISQLESEMQSVSARTLGEYLAGLNPHLQKVRRIWTARWMFEREFDLVWNTQQQFYPSVLTQELRAEIQKLLFYQRPIAKQSHLIGRCELEPNEPRSPWAMVEAQTFRVLQKVNDLAIILPGFLDSRPLNHEERSMVLNALQNEGDQTFASLRQLLKLPRGSHFNLERGEEKRLSGNRTDGTPRFLSLGSDEQRDSVERLHA